jgi:hypothetical protein
MTTLARLAIGALLALLGTSCQMDLNWGTGVRGNGTVIRENRNVTESFTAISAAEGMNVFVNQGDNLEIVVEADENILELIGTDIRDGELKIHAIENIGRATRKIYVTLPEVTGLYASSGADLVSDGMLDVNRIRVDASSGADIRVQLSADEISASCSSGADIYMEGQTNQLFATASSGSDIKARNLKAAVCEANASSGADIHVYVSESLKADASSGGDIRYDGAAQANLHKSSAGSVRKF